MLFWRGDVPVRAALLGVSLVIGTSRPGVAAPVSPVDAGPTLSVDLGAGSTIELVLIRAGSSSQGSLPAEAGRSADETPRFVTIGHDFYIGRTEVTVAQFRRFVDETGYRSEAETGKSGGFGFDGTRLVQRPEFNWKNPGFVQAENHPVTLVTYGDALAFVGWLSVKAGRACSLPTEAEWEHAYRAGTVTPFYTGSTEDSAAALGWFKLNAGNGTRPVQQKAPNAFGLYDMGGNVFEWCRDWYGPYAGAQASDPEVISPPAGDKPRRVLRGGSWLKDAKSLRAAARYRNDPGSRNADNGFRITAATEPRSPRGAEPASSAGATTRSESRAQSDRGSSLSLLFFAVTGLLSVAALGFVIAMVQRSRRPRALPGAPPGVTYRRVKDGFWLNTPSPLHGSVLHYRANVVGRDVRASVPIEASARGQFVYTGGAPGDVQAEQIVGMSAAQAYAAAVAIDASHERSAGRRKQVPDNSGQFDEPDSSPAFRGYPGAY